MRAFLLAEAFPFSQFFLFCFLSVVGNEIAIPDDDDDEGVDDDKVGIFEGVCICCLEIGRIVDFLTDEGVAAAVAADGVEVVENGTLVAELSMLMLLLATFSFAVTK